MEYFRGAISEYDIIIIDKKRGRIDVRDDVIVPKSATSPVHNIRLTSVNPRVLTNRPRRYIHYH